MLAEHINVYEEHRETNTPLTWKYKTEKQYKEEFEFLKEVDSMALIYTNKSLRNAYANFFRYINGGKKFGYPSFKKRKDCGSYTTTNFTILDDNHIRLGKCGVIRFKKSKKLQIQGKPVSITITKTSTEKYFCSISLEHETKHVEKIQLTDESNVIGLDMSLPKFFVDSNGNSPEFQKFYKIYDKKLKKLRFLMYRKENNSRKQKKLRKSINLIKEKIFNKRKDFSHKLSLQVVRQNDVIVVENLRLQQMSQTCHFGTTVNDLGYSQFINQLRYKCEKYGKHFIQADRLYASTKTCHICGYKNKSLTLKDREWICPNCNTKHDRDINAAMNLKNLGIDSVRKCLQS